MILAEDLERLVVRRASFVNEIVDARMPGYQFFPLLKPGLKSEYELRHPMHKDHMHEELEPRFI